MACHKALTDELAGEAKTREANDTVLGTQLQEVRAALAEFATRSWCEQEFSAKRERLIGKLEAMLQTSDDAIMQETRERREANDRVLGTTSAEPVQVPCTKCQKLMPRPLFHYLGTYCSAECEYPPCAGPQCSQKRPDQTPKIPVS